MSRTDVYVMCLMADELDFYYKLKERGVCWERARMSDRKRIAMKAVAMEEKIRKREMQRKLC